MGPGHSGNLALCFAKTIDAKVDNGLRHDRLFFFQRFSFPRGGENGLEEGAKAFHRLESNIEPRVTAAAFFRQLASVHKCLRPCDLCKELAFGASTRK
jgi:hypothetical protein